SRRRHTRSKRDWSSDVCSSDLEFEAEIQKVVEQKGLDLFLLMVTDILNSNSEVLAIGEAENKVENAFQVQLAEHRALLEGVVSRKKQIVTPLDAAFN